ncbi:MAG: ferritin-like domain-containing protein [Cyanobacteria bacterium P01_G01_bin.4]
MVMQVAKDFTESKLTIANCKSAKDESVLADKHTHIRYLICQYLSFDTLDGLVQELPEQFEEPQVRHWRFIDWDAIAPEQVHGFDLEVYLNVIAGAVETEIPIRGYSQTSRQYLERLHPNMARFVGGTTDMDGTPLAKGLWEREEQRHTPALLRIYRQLSGRHLSIDVRDVREFSPSCDPRSDLYRHGMHRIATEYGATCLYLWLMSHSTGTLRQVWGELLRDEINHMTKFWGFGAWAYPFSTPGHLRRVAMQLAKTVSDRPQANDRHGQSSLPRTLRRMAEVMTWQDWTPGLQAEFSLICMRVLIHMLRWSRRLTRDSLKDVFGPLPDVSC